MQIQKKKSNFKKINLNPKQRKTSDCVIRALAAVFNKGWLEVYDELTDLARSLYSVPGASETIKEYLKEYPVIPVKYENEFGTKKRYKVKDICEWEGSYIVKVSNHITCVIDGYIQDIWDCSDHAAYIIWKIS